MTPCIFKEHVPSLDYTGCFILEGFTMKQTLFIVTFLGFQALNAFVDFNANNLTTTHLETETQKK